MKSSALASLSIRATPKAVRWLGLWTAIMMAMELLSLIEGLSWLGVGVWLVQLVGLCLCAVFVWEYVRLIGVVKVVSQMEVVRTVNANLPVHETSKVTLQFYQEEQFGKHNLSAYHFEVMDYLPSSAHTHDLPLSFYGGDFDEGAGVALAYELYLFERGVVSFGGVDWLISTPLGLLQKYHHTPADKVGGTHTVRVLANFKAVVQGHLLAISKNTTVGGMIKRKRRGQGQDFHQIRPYSEGDSVRHVDWRATSRHQRLMSREYQDETDQEIMFLLDAGCHMRHTRFADGISLDEQIGGDEFNDKGQNISHLDMALNAMLLLAEVAGKQADSVGFMSFGAEVDKIAPAKKGAGVMSYLLNQSFDLQASTKTLDYMSIAKKTLSTQKRRSLIIMITNIRTDNTDELIGAVNLLTSKHRVILVNLYEQDLGRYVQDFGGSDYISLDNALTYHSVHAYLNDQRTLNVRLADETGAMVLGSTPIEMPQKLIDSYWAVKRVGAL